MLQAYVVMYQAHKDSAYLEKLIAQFDQVLQNRDNVRGVTDWRGKSLPSWRSVGDYTCGALTLRDKSGRPAVQLRCGARPADRVSVTVEPGKATGTFTVTATLAPAGKKKSAEPIVDRYDNLSLDPASPNYAPTRINAEFAKINGTPAGPRVMLTCYDARTDAPATAAAPASLEVEPVSDLKMVAMPYIFAVQVGHLLTPVATFVRLVNETPELRDNPKYKQKADEYLEAIEDAVAVHDFEWRENRDGEGWLYWTKGSPNMFDGCDQPHNQYLSLGRVMIQLAAVVKDPVRKATYLDRARKMATTFKNDLQRTDENTYRWTYFWTKGVAYKGWTLEDDVSEAQPALVWPKPGGVTMVEDTSHAVLDIDFVRLAYENNLGVFAESDMKRLPRTFVTSIIKTKNDRTTFAEGVDGTGGVGGNDNACGSWMMLAPYDARIADAIKSNFDSRHPKPGPPAIPLAIAYMNWWAKMNNSR